MAKKLQMCGTEEEMRDVAAKICRDYLHGAWKTVESKDLTFKRISGGLSNFLYYIALPDRKNSPVLGNSPTNETAQQRRNTLATIQAAARTASDPDISTSQLHKQRSNSLSLAEEPKKVLLRIYGQTHGERAMEAIITESVIFTLLSERRLGPKLHGVFSGGRIEEFIPARPLLTNELAEPALSMKIAEKMAAIHSMDIPLSKEPQWLWKSLNKWMRTTNEVLDAPTAKNDDEKQCVEKLKSLNFEKEIEWLQQYLTSINSQVVFCHNDMQEGNILIMEDESATADDTNDDTNDDYSQYDFERSSSPMTVATDSPVNGKENKRFGNENNNGSRVHFMDEETNTRDSMYSHVSDNGEPKLVLIDFEYCAYNYRAFDIANHFLEWSFDYTNNDYPHYYDKPEQYPTLEQKVIFMRQYLKHCNLQMQRLGSGGPDLEIEPSIDDINSLNTEVESFTLASHMLWCLWSVVSASRSQIPFGYWRYAVTRLDGYQRHKSELMKKESAGKSLKRKICEMDI